MKPQVQALLLETLVRQEAIEAEPPMPTDYIMEYQNRDKRLRLHGPEFSWAWFCTDDPAERKRILRALDEVERKGWIEVWRPRGGYLKHVRLTAAGLLLARELAEQEAAGTEAKES